jgi:hypothetical protein
MKKNKGKDDAIGMLDKILAFASESAKSSNAREQEGSFGIMISFSPSDLKKRGYNKSTIEVEPLTMPSKSGR